MTFQFIPGLAYNGHPVAYDDGVVAQTAPGSATSPSPSPVPTFQSTPIILPAEITGREHMDSILPWMPWVDNATNRKISAHPLSDTNCWLLHFKVVAANPRPVRIQAAEWTSQAAQRNWALIRDRDGKVMFKSKQPSTTITQMLYFPGQIPAFAALFGMTADYPLVEVGVDYTVAIWNRLGELPSTMLGELYL